MSAGAALARPEAIAIARSFVDLLDGTYTDLKVAGSLRRRLAVAHDIEIVAVPKVLVHQDGLLGDMTSTADLLDLRMAALLEAGTVTKRLDRNGTPRWGPTLKFLTFTSTSIDLFCPERDRFGWILVLRTGPAAFSRQLVVERGQQTKDGRPGLLPSWLKPRDGWLTSRVSGERIVTPDERSVFLAMGLPYTEPWERR